MTSAPNFPHAAARGKAPAGKTRLLAGLAAVLTCAGALADAEVLLIRHGEKPEAGLGQLSCKGLNRALALPGVVEKRFGRPDLVLAPDPGHAKDDRGIAYSYVRPLATVEPTAIRFGLPVETAYGHKDTDGIVARIAREAEHSGGRRILVAWQHRAAADIARRLLGRFGGDVAAVPDWPDEDYDSIFVLRLGNAGGANFRVERQRLDDLPDACP